MFNIFRKKKMSKGMRIMVNLHRGEFRAGLRLCKKMVKLMPRGKVKEPYWSKELLDYEVKND